MIIFRHWTTGLCSTDYLDIATERNPGIFSPESTSSTFKLGPANGYTEGMGRRWDIEQKWQGQQIVQTRDPCGHRKIIAVGKTTDYGRKSSVQSSKKEREFSGQRDQEPGVDEIETRLCHQRLQK